MKKILPLLFVAFLMLSSLEICAQQLPYRDQQKVDQLFKKSKVVYFKFAVRSMQEVPHFSKILSVDKTKGVTIFAHADKAQFTNFVRMNMPYTVLPSPQKKPATVKKTTAGTKTTTVKKTTTTKAPVKK